MHVNKQTEEPVAQLEPVQAEFSQMDLVHKIRLRFRRGGNAVLGQLAGNEGRWEKKRTIRGLPGQFGALSVHDSPGRLTAAKFGIGHNDDLIGSRVEASRFFDANRPNL